MVQVVLNRGQIINYHFSQLTKLVEIGSSNKRVVKDWKFDHNTQKISRFDYKKPALQSALIFIVKLIE